MTRIAFSCARCGAKVVPQKGRDRFRDYRRDLALPIPDDFLLPTCTGCGETYESPRISERLDKLQSKVFRQACSNFCKQVVRTLLSRPRLGREIAVCDIDRVCGVENGYIDRVIAEKTTPSMTYILLLEAYLASPKAFAKAIRHTIAIDKEHDRA